MSKSYIVRNARTGTTVGAYRTRKAAHRRADALDNKYGAVSHVVIYNVLLRTQS